ncbi:MAG: UDP-glucose--hexose-1-phosphate uridylyltransferase [Furfurilactobacillus sp.]|jgi:UDPglucose--hexose-1-phosphate uridylyltransferase|uniref:UDP-glucose--hexose-1-phosphate uridylyltransferase n=1 Tax=Furfurilactobacillus TaxID=2767882 RepID=UPI001F379A70|nr:MULTISPECIES: UDP-glucose--hexose-1-phosphate uridylyltransferase [Furfurilactobacillus]MCF6418936.1 UDP-glucose--hexose-1-phosphate uridylyltransferase [Furfurilactobacillus milii]MCH4011252.1 UDP-glucose--hexose-1-phosphate uridylyltransferase [Furfurilactobacillus sp.]MCH4037144.1 UDP-glucose--hexose-1-phosphate uridylyltransferase [Furfurilactobacillus sp.]MCH4116218.1 UDP-glucose--hexose-1-phosphate uridylyltransferase [Furfurilactobacillus sp.]MCH4133146.1 UDP-glucose--hexose-1-phosph
MVEDAVENLISLAVQNGAAEPLDRVYLRNRIFALIGDEMAVALEGNGVEAVSEALVNAAVENGKIEDNQTARELLDAQLMDLTTPRPSQVNERFWEDYQTSPEAATKYFYGLSKANNYIKTKAIAKNIVFNSATTFGDLEITINLSKPEKDPKAIAAAAHTAASGYPLCQLCLENEGYLGRLGYPARSNHRVIRLTVGGRPWGFQYSPYAYFGEHAIFLDQQHVPMKINRQTFTNLFEIITQFPQYFVGSNADLPIVGGSMLSHEHYQGGRHNFPMMKAPIASTFKLADYPDVKCGVVKWAMSTIRLTGTNQQSVADAAEHIREVWNHYDDPAVSVKAYDGETRHHTVTPIAYRNGDQFVLDIVLRDNQTSTAYPDGIFHPHKDVQHIKKENIGLIEVMGRAILPARLKTEMQEVQKFLLDQPNDMADYHRTWAEELKENNTITNDNVEQVVDDAIGKVFGRVLEDAGVFKWNAAGREAQARFIKAIE